MAKVLEAIVEISGRDRTGNIFSKIGNKAEVADRKLRQVSARQKAFATAGRMVATAAAEIAASVGAVEIVRRSAETYMDFEKTMTNLGITAGATDDQIKAAGRTLQEQAPLIGQTGQQWSEVAQNLVAAGTGFNDAIGATPIVARTAKAETADMIEVSAAANATMQNLGVTVTDLGKAMDMMAAGGKAGSFELKDMAREFPSVAASASRLGFQGTDGVARLVAMLEIARKTTGEGSQAATNMRQAFDKMFSPTVQTAWKKNFGTPLTKILEDAGKTGQNKFEAVLDAINKKTHGLSETAKQSLIGKVFNDEQARNGILAMLRFMDQYKDTLAEIRASGGTVDRDLGRVLNTTAGKWDQMVASLNRAGATLGEALAPGVKNVAESVTQLTNEFQGLVDGIGLADKALDGFFNSAKGASGEKKQEAGSFSDWMDWLFNRAGSDTRKSVIDGFTGKKPQGSRGMGTHMVPTSPEERATKFGSDMGVAVTGGKVPTPAAGAGLNELVPYITNKIVLLASEQAKMLVGKAQEAKPAGQQSFRMPLPGDRTRLIPDAPLAEIDRLQQERDRHVSESKRYADQADRSWFAPRYFRRHQEEETGYAADTQAQIDQAVARRERQGLGPGRSPTGMVQPQPQQVDVTGKVTLDPASKATVQVNVKVDGGAVTGMSATAGGNLKANVGVSMGGAAHVSRRDE